MTKKKRWVIDSLVLIFSIVIIAQLLTYAVPQGKFEREPYPKNPSREMVVPGSYAAVGAQDEVALKPWHFLTAVPKGLEAAQEIVFLVFLVGGVIAVLRATGAIDAFLHTAVAKLGRSPWVLIGGCLVLFGMGSWTIGMGEEYVPLIPILITMSLAMKMDAIVAMGMIWVPYGIGWACAGTNPFGVLIAQDIAGLAPTSGWPFRLGLLVIFLAVGFQHVYTYALKVRRDPSTSLVADVDYSDGFEAPDDIRLTGTRLAILLVFVLGIVGFVIGASTAGWYIRELLTIFLAIGVLAAAIGRLSPVKTSQTFIHGAGEMTAAALIIGFARAIEVVLNDGQIIDTVIHSIASLLEGTGPAVSAVGMLAVQSVCNFFIPSGSGQAFVTMPIMSPLATLTGVPQQVAVLAYQFGDGFSNMLVPTSALVMGTLALGRIPYGRWLRFAAPLLGKLLLVAIAILIFAVYLGEAAGLGA
ncbi:MAG: YfcC family protein [bacterium]|nr:YfcC family protein [bacterium]